MRDVDLYMSKPSSDNQGGDLGLSAPMLDENGEHVVDLALSYHKDVLKQIVYARVVTQAPDWFIHPKLGGNLEDLIGEPNTRSTAEAGINLINNALTYGDFLKDEEFIVKAIPVNREEVLFIIRVTGLAEEVVIPIQFNYKYGMKLVEG